MNRKSFSLPLIVFFPIIFFNFSLHLLSYLCLLLFVFCSLFHSRSSSLFLSFLSLYLSLSLSCFNFLSLTYKHTHLLSLSLFLFYVSLLVFFSFTLNFSFFSHSVFLISLTIYLNSFPSKSHYQFIIIFSVSFFYVASVIFSVPLLLRQFLHCYPSVGI